MPRAKGQIGGIQGAVLGLLGLLLGFTFAMAVGRYDTRRGLVLKEANAIGTTYLRASLLPDTHQDPVKTCCDTMRTLGWNIGPWSMTQRNSPRG